MREPSTESCRREAGPALDSQPAERPECAGSFDGDFQQKKVLIVDDDDAIRRLLGAVLKSRYQIDVGCDGHEALRKFHSFAPDLVLLDILMPGLDGLEVCRCIKGSPQGRWVQVIMISGNSSRDERRAALEAGADDYVVKPIHAHELPARIDLHFRLQHTQRMAHDVRSEISRYNADAHDHSRSWTEQLIATEDAALFALAKVAEARDEDTGQHLFRMRSYARILAEELGRDPSFAAMIDRRFLRELWRSSPLHDIGKVAVSDAILRKPGPLTAEEFEVMKRHTVIGAKIVEEAAFDSRSTGFLSMAATIARFHHERFDGTGYPTGLAGTEIPLSARIVALADVYDAITSARPYKGPIPPPEAKCLIERESGRHFDPAIVRAFRSRFDAFLEAAAALDREENFDEELAGCVDPLPRSQDKQARPSESNDLQGHPSVPLNGALNPPSPIGAAL